MVWNILATSAAKHSGHLLHSECTLGNAPVFTEDKEHFNVAGPAIVSEITYRAEEIFSIRTIFKESIFHQFITLSMPRK